MSLYDYTVEEFEVLWDIVEAYFTGFPKENTMSDNQIRINAMKWWNAMSFEDKWYKIIKYKVLVLGYPERTPNSLTGREIENIYKAHVTDKVKII
jgi:hypothetical protein